MLIPTATLQKMSPVTGGASDLAGSEESSLAYLCNLGGWVEDWTQGGKLTYKQYWHEFVEKVLCKPPWKQLEERLHQEPSMTWYKLKGINWWEAAKYLSLFGTFYGFFSVSHLGPRLLCQPPGNVIRLVDTILVPHVTNGPYGCKDMFRRGIRDSFLHVIVLGVVDQFRQVHVLKGLATEEGFEQVACLSGSNGPPLYQISFSSVKAWLRLHMP